jgi:hypothetical protein
VRLRDGPHRPEPGQREQQLKAAGVHGSSVLDL